MNFPFHPRLEALLDPWISSWDQPRYSMKAGDIRYTSGRLIEYKTGGNRITMVPRSYSNEMHRFIDTWMVGGSAPILRIGLMLKQITMDGNERDRALILGISEALRIFNGNRNRLFAILRWLNEIPQLNGNKLFMHYIRFKVYFNVNMFSLMSPNLLGVSISRHALITDYMNNYVKPGLIGDSQSVLGDFLISLGSDVELRELGNVFEAYNTERNLWLAEQNGFGVFPIDSVRDICFRSYRGITKLFPEYVYRFVSSRLYETSDLLSIAFQARELSDLVRLHFHTDVHGSLANQQEYFQNEIGMTGAQVDQYVLNTCPPYMFNRIIAISQLDSGEIGQACKLVVERMRTVFGAPPVVFGHYGNVRRFHSALVAVLVDPSAQNMLQFNSAKARILR